jgi:hypothetical protein
MHGTEIDEPRPPGALLELDADPSSRKRFLKAIGGTAAAGALATFLAACGGTEEPPPTPGGSNPNTGAGVGTDRYGPGDRGIAAFLLTLEFIEVDFYEQALASGKLKGQAAELARRFVEQERQHQRALSEAITRLGGELPEQADATFPLETQESIVTFAGTIEGMGAAALLGQVGRIQDKEFLAVAFTMHSVEGRHVAAVNELLGEDPAPDGAFAKPVFAADVINQLHNLTASG